MSFYFIVKVSGTKEDYDVSLSLHINELLLLTYRRAVFQYRYNADTLLRKQKWPAGQQESWPH